MIDQNLSKKYIVSFSTKDRKAFTVKSVPNILNSGVSVVWFDGSSTKEGKALPSEYLKFKNLIEIKYNITGGPDSAIFYALEYLHKEYEHAWIILIENDILLEDDWLLRLDESIESANSSGISVGAATVRVIENRVICRLKNYGIVYNCGAGFIAIKRQLVPELLNNYRTTTVNELMSFYDSIGIDLTKIWEFNDYDRYFKLSADWFFEIIILSLRHYVICTAGSSGFNLDTKKKYALKEEWKADENFKLFKFNNIDPLLNQIKIDNNKFLTPVTFLNLEKPILNIFKFWKKIWTQNCGPFGLSSKFGILDLRHTPISFDSFLVRSTRTKFNIVIFIFKNRIPSINFFWNKNDYCLNFQNTPPTHLIMTGMGSLCILGGISNNFNTVNLKSSMPTFIKFIKNTK